MKASRQLQRGVTVEHREAGIDARPATGPVESGGLLIDPAPVPDVVIDLGRCHPLHEVLVAAHRRFDEEKRAVDAEVLAVARDSVSDLPRYGGPVGADRAVDVVPNPG